MQQCSSADRSILFTTRIVRSVEHNKERFKCFPKANSKNWSCCFFLSARSHYSASPISPPKAVVVAAVKTEAMAAKAVKVEMAASKPADKKAKAGTAVVVAIKVAVVAEIMVAALEAAKVEMVEVETVKVETVKAETAAAVTMAAA